MSDISFISRYSHPGTGTKILRLYLQKTKQEKRKEHKQREVKEKNTKKQENWCVLFRQYVCAEILLSIRCFLSLLSLTTRTY